MGEVTRTGRPKLSRAIKFPRTNGQRGNIFIFLHDQPTTGQLITTVLVVVMCVCVFSSNSFWTSSSLDVPEGHTGFLIHLLSALRALIFLARRIQPFLSLVDREVEFCVLNDLIVLHPLGILFSFFSFLVSIIPFAGLELTSQRVRELRGTSELPGRPVHVIV